MSENYTSRVATKNFTPRVPESLSPTRNPRIPQPLQWNRQGTGGSGGGFVGPWGIYPAGGGDYAVACGNIYTDFGSVSDDDLLDIAEFDLTFAPSATTVVYLELDNTTTPTIELKAGSAWAEHPETFKLTTTGVIRAEKAFFRLWHGVSGDMPPYSQGIQFDGFWMKRTCRSNDVILAYGDHELEGGTRNIPVPILFPM